MAIDYDAKTVPINYEGGSIRMVVGNAKDLFGEDATVLAMEGVEKTVSVKGHTRTRVIGGPSTPVEGGPYTYTQWPISGGGNAAGGEAILMRWEGSEGWWTARLTGSAWELGTFLNKTVTKATEFKTAQGISYGPFIKAT